MSGLRISNLSFKYKNTSIFKNLCLNIDDDQWIGILGPNGAGKTTFLKILMGLLPSPAGTISIRGQHPGHGPLKKITGSSFQDIDFPENLKSLEVLQFVGSHYSSKPDYRQLAKDFFLEDFINKKCGTLSGGMRRRLSLAAAILGGEKLLFLDEPTTGLDNSSRKQLLQNIEKHRKKHKALILMISHHPEDIADYVNNFLLFKSQGDPSWISPEKIGALSQMKTVRFQSNMDLKFSDAISVKTSGSKWIVTTNSSDDLIKQLSRQTLDFKNLDIQSLSWDTIFKEHL